MKKKLNKIRAKNTFFYINYLIHFQVTETLDTNISADQEEVVDSETTVSLLSSVSTPKPRASQKSKTADPILEKAQNNIHTADDKRGNKYSSFGEHIAYKLSK